MSDSPSTITSSQQIIIKFETMNQTTPSPQQAKTSRLQKYYGIPVLATILFIFFFVLADHLFPLPIFNQDDYAAMIVAEDSTPLRAYAGQNGVWRYPLKSSEVSPLYLQALLNYEDRYYYYHFGVNPAAILRGLIQNIRAGHVVSGGSTLTMQVARIIDPRGHGYRAKLQQVFRALQLEYHCSKEEILTLYLNHAPYGGTVEGIGAASLTYFGKPPFELSHAEAALLAVLPQRPSALRPDRYPGRAERARDKVLDRMATFGIWSPAAVYQAKKEEVVAVHHVQPMLAPLLANRLRSETVAGTSLVTTINAQLQANLADCVANYAASVDDKVSAAVMVVENETMAVRAYVGSADFFSRERQGQVDMIRSVRSPGSTLKPFLYGMALDRGLIHSGSLLIDAPRFYSSYRPNNFGSGFSGPVSAAEALQRSLNLPAIQLIEQLGPASFTAGLAKGGVRLRLPSGGAPNPAIILGGAGTRLEDLVAAYTSLARKGRVGKLRYLRAQLSDPISDKYLLSEGAAWIIRTILAANPRPDRYRTSAVAETNPAWKTGTSYGFRDAWAMGVTPKYTIGVWVGRPDATPVPDTSGARTAAPLLFMISDYLAKPGEFFSPAPDSVTIRTICWPLGTEKSALNDPALCQQELQAFVLNNNLPPTLPSADQRERGPGLYSIRVDAQSGLLVPKGCPVANTKTTQIATWPKELHPWLSDASLAAMPPLAPTCKPQNLPTTDPITITSLADGSILTFSPDTPNPTILLQTVGGYGTRYWFVNGQPHSQGPSTSSAYTFNSPGIYLITVLDDTGHSDNITLTVKM